METFGELLKRKRLEKGLKQIDAAEMLSISQSAVSNYESGRVTPPSNTMRSLISLLNITEDDLKVHTDERIDKVELAILNSPLSWKDQDIVLTVYGHFSNRDSVAIANILRLSQQEGKTHGSQ